MDRDAIGVGDERAIGRGDETAEVMTLAEDRAACRSGHDPAHMACDLI